MDKGFQFDMDIVAKNIQEMRKAAGFRTQQDLADAAGIALNSVSRYEKENPRTPKVDAFALIANALKSECDADYLLGLQEHPKKTTSEISKLVPLGRDAINSLEQLNEIVKNGDPLTYVDAYDGYMEEDASLIAGIIDRIIKGLTWRIDKSSLLEDISSLKDAIELHRSTSTDGKLHGDWRLVEASNMAIQSASYELGRTFALFIQEYIEEYIDRDLEEA